MLLKVYTLLPFNVYSFNLQIKEITYSYNNKMEKNVDIQ